MDVTGSGSCLTAAFVLAVFNLLTAFQGDGRIMKGPYIPVIVLESFNCNERVIRCKTSKVSELKNEHVFNLMKTKETQYLKY